MPFRKGKSGNPSGRRPGLSTAGKLRKAIEGHLPGIIDVMVQAALAGDVQAAKLLLDKTMPNVKPTDTTVKLGLTGTLSNQAETVLSEFAAGRITPSETESIMRSIKTAAAVAEVDELRQRIEALEDQRR